MVGDIRDDQILIDTIIQLRYDLVRQGYDSWIEGLIEMMKEEKYDEVVVEMKSMIASNRARIERNKEK